MAWPHITNDDLERYCLKRISDQAELAAIEEHLLACPNCIARAEEEQELVDVIRAALSAEGRSLS